MRPRASLLFPRVFGGLALVFACTDPVEEMKVTISDLRSKDAAIPASAVELSFPKPDADSYEWGLSDRFETLWPEPPAKLAPDVRQAGVVQPIWLKVRVPRDARPGTYSATLAVNYSMGIRDINLKPQPPIQVPVELVVNDWTLPDPKDYRTFVDLIQSPESVAMRFKLPLWSAEHFRRMEKSFRLLAEIGNKSVYLPLITCTHFGNSESMLRFVRQGDGPLAPDFDVIDRYLDLADRTQGKPSVVVLYLWDVYTSQDHTPLVTELDPASGKTKEVEAPKYATAEGKAFWGPAIKQLRERLARRGLDKELVIGIVGDWNHPKKEHVEFFKEIVPGMLWTEQCHGLISRIADVPVGYATTVWNARGPDDPAVRRTAGWAGSSLVCQFNRDLRRGHPLFVYRTSSEWNIAGYQRGQGRLGGDFWNVLARGEKEILDTRHSAGNTIVHRFPRHSDWSQLVVRTSFLACGKEGAIPSVHFEMLREGVPDCEARIFVEKSLADKDLRAKLGEDLAGRAQKMLDGRTWVVAHASRASAWFYASGFDERQQELYSAVAAVAAALRMK